MSLSVVRRKSGPGRRAKSIPEPITDPSLSRATLEDLWFSSAVMPDQFKARPSPYSIWLRELHFAMLEDALRVISWGKPQEYWTKAQHKFHQETEAWFADDQSDDPFAITTVCDVLQIRYETILRIKERTQRRPSFEMMVTWIPIPV